MTIALWKLPFPSSGRDGLNFQQLLGRSCVITCYAAERETARLIFDGVEAFKCSYHHSCTIEMVQSYDTLSDVGATDWLYSVREQLSHFGEDVQSLRHLMIYFDDGPCYEFICRSFRIETEPAI